jgi:two-component sensor histidine kinase
LTVVYETETDTEDARLAAVIKFAVLDTEPDNAFDRITALSARRFAVPVSLISIVDEKRIWFKSRHGLPIPQIERLPGLCSSAILGDEPYVLTNAALDKRSSDNPLVTGDFGLRFYAAVPLVTSDGLKIGTLNVIDFRPREVSDSEMIDLQDLAGLVMDQMELRLSATKAIAHSKLMAREIDHRVMNSLQFVSALLTLQSRSQSSDHAMKLLEAAASRVAAVAQVHRHLYSHDAEETSCVNFLHRLCADLAKILGKEVVVTGIDESVPTELIQPIGLIVNELVTNSAKHGATRIDVMYLKSGSDRRLAIVDDGTGLPEAFDPEAGSGLGMKVISGLVRQLKGTFAGQANLAGRGSTFEIIFPLKADQPKSIS